MKFKIWMSVGAVTLFSWLAMPVGGIAQDNPSQDHKSKHHSYKFNVGTFGGPASYFSNGFDGLLNNQGTAVGWADTAKAEPLHLRALEIVEEQPALRTDEISVGSTHFPTMLRKMKQEAEVRELDARIKILSKTQGLFTCPLLAR